jgi:hypothetical protein
MKAIAAWIIALALIAGGVTATAIALRSEPRHAITQDPCVGFGCWPESPSVRYRPAHRAALPPVW